jgi:peptidoglycan-associated lipoprotein
MSFSRIKNFGYTLFVLSALLTFGCHKKTVANTPPPPPPVNPAPSTPAPTITLRAQPSSIDRGGSTTLQWEARNAATVTITPELGSVAVTGTRSVTPASSVTYTASATGPGGTATDTARITVNIPAPAAADDEPRRPTVTGTGLAAEFRDKVKDIRFDYDKADILPEFVPVLQGNVTWLKANPNVRFTVEGHCDDRGTEEYNLGLGDRRANAVKEFLVSQGVAANRMNTVSYGEEKPACREETETCFAMNRRAHFELAQ